MLVFLLCALNPVSAAIIWSGCSQGDPGRPGNPGQRGYTGDVGVEGVHGQTGPAGVQGPPGPVLYTAVSKDLHFSFM